jgi:hypothetical protein
MKSYATQQQDLFAYYLLGRTGFYLDFGCWMPEHCNNTKMLEELGWDGLLFDMDRAAITACFTRRKALSFCVKIMSDEFKKCLFENLPSREVDFISVDIDYDSLDLLKFLVEENITFKTMTFEHNYYSHGDEFKVPAKLLLESQGYERLFENIITIPTHCERSMKEYPDGQKLEDWWINPECFPPDLLTLRAKNIHFAEAIKIVRDWKGPSP